MGYLAVDYYAGSYFGPLFEQAAIGVVAGRPDNYFVGNYFAGPYFAPRFFDSSSNVQADTTAHPFDVNLHEYLSNILGTYLQAGHIARDTQVWPAISLFLVSEERDVVLPGPTGMVVSAWQFDVWGPLDLDVVLLGDQLRRALSGYSGFMGSSFILNTRLTNRAKSYEQMVTVDQSDMGIYRVMLEAEIWYMEDAVRFP